MEETPVCNKFVRKPRQDISEEYPVHASIKMIRTVKNWADGSRGISQRQPCGNENS